MAFRCNCAFSVNHLVFVVFQMQLNSARWTSWLSLGHTSCITPPSCVHGYHAWLCACACVICAGQLAACMQLCYNDADAVICFCHLLESARERESERPVTSSYVCVRMKTHEWYSGVCETEWLSSHLSLLWLFLVQLLLFPVRMLEFYVWWWQCVYVWCCV